MFGKSFTVCGILGKVWYLIVLIPNLCHLLYFDLRFICDLMCLMMQDSMAGLMSVIKDH